MSQDQNDVPVGNILNSQQTVAPIQGVVEQPRNEQPCNEPPRSNPHEKLKQHYLHQARRLCHGLPSNVSEALLLEELLRKTKNIISMLTCYDRPWENGMPEIRKACFTFLTADNVPRKERLQCIEKWGDWTEFLLGASRYRVLVAHLLQYYLRQRSDLEKLLGREAARRPDAPAADFV